MPNHRLARVAVLASLLLASSGAGSAAAAPDPPAARAALVTDRLSGTAITDPYRWMEAEPAPEFARLLHAQDDHTRAVLSRIPGRDRLLSAISALDGLSTEVRMLTTANAKRFYLRLDAGTQLSRLVMQDTQVPDAAATVLVDPAELGTSAGQAEIDQFAPSPDGSLVAYGISGSSGNSVLHVIETATRRIRRDVIDRARFARPSWAPDGRSFFYARLPRPDPRAPASDATPHLRVYRHRLGEDPDRDRLILDADRLPEAFGEATSGVAPVGAASVGAASVGAAQIFPALVVPPGSDTVLAEIGDGVSPEVAIYAAPYASLELPQVPWKRVAARSDGVVAAAVRGSRIDLLTHRDAPHFKIVETDLDRPSFAEARLRVRPGSGVLTGLGLAADGLYLARRDGSATTLLRLADGAGLPEIVTLPFSGSIAPAGVDAGGLHADPRRTGVDVGLQSWTHPLVWLHYDPATRAVADLGLVPGFAHDLRAYQSVETSARGLDGTLIPLSIVGRRDRRRDGPRPVLLEGYGAYGIADDPAFMPTLLPWLDGGGIYAVAHVRGGGEGGQSWHDGGRLANKINGVTDLIACARALIARHVTDAAHLAGSGTGAGGILIGGAITRAPELFRAALIRGGATDLLREQSHAELPSNIPEFGSVADPAQLPALLEIDALAHVRDGVAYPAVLLTGNASDPRVPVGEPAKMAARLQRASRSGRPVLLRIDDAGQGLEATRAQRDAEAADEQAFLLWQMGEPDDQPQTP